MKKNLLEKNLVIGIMILLVGAGFISGVSSDKTAFGKTIIVDDDAIDDPVNHTWNTINEALDDAQNGDTIKIYNGTYYENLVIEKKVEVIGQSTDLFGNDIDGVIIDGTESGDVVKIITTELKIKGLIVQNSGNDSGNAGLFINSDLVTISNCTLLNNNDGIYLDEASNHITISDCLILSNYVGINISDSSNANTISNCSILSNLQTGILLFGSSNNIISDCSLQNSTLGGISLVEGSSGNVIQNCCIQHNWRGIQIDSNSTSNKISSCSIANNYWGIKLADSMFNRIEKCTISNNYCGIMRGNLNFIHNNNFLNSEVHHAWGEWEHMNFWLRNYWGGHGSPLPFHLYGLNVDWFPKARPYDYPTPYDVPESNPDDTSQLDWDDNTLLERDFEEITTHHNLKDRTSRGLLSLLSRSHNVLNDDIPRLCSWFDEHELFNRLDAREYMMNLKEEID